MAEVTRAALRERFAEIEARLDGDNGTSRQQLKTDIIALFRTVDREIAELSSLKEDIKTLVGKWKAQRDHAPATPTAPSAPIAPAPSLAPGHLPTPVRSDHIGASTFIEKGWGRISLGEHAAAEAALTKALELSPNDSQAESLLGWAQMLQEKHDEALLNFQRVLTREPSNALARINVGYICLKKRIFGEAIEHLSKAIRLDNDPKATLYAHYYLGLVYLEREMYEDAQTFFRKSLTLGPNLIEAWYELGRALWFGDDREAALEAWRDGAAANKFNPWGTRCAEMIELVKGGGGPTK